MNALVKARGWENHKPVIDQSEGLLSNGVVGRIRSKAGENCGLDKLDALAKVFGVPAHELIQPPHSTSLTWRRTAEKEASELADPKLRQWMFAFFKSIDELVAERAELANSAPEISIEVNTSQDESAPADQK